MTQVGSVYGEALYDLAWAENLSGQILEQLSVLTESFRQEPDFPRLLAAPSLSKEDRCQILDDCFRDRVHPYVLNFLKILAEKGYIRHFSDCCQTYREHYDRDNGILPVRAVTAVALTQRQSGELTRKLSAVTGKTVRLTNRVDPDILGGVRLDYDGKSLEDTVRHRLDAVRTVLKNAVL